MIKSVNINSYARKHLIPLNALLELTYHCNLNCEHCYIKEKINKEKLTEELSFERVKEVIDGLEALGTFSITLTGGEVFLRKDLFDIIDYITQKKFKFCILTNGLEIEKYAEQLKNAFTNNIFLDKIRVSLYGITPETHKTITNNAKSFEKSINGIKLLKKLKINVEISFVLSKFNIHELYYMEEFAKNLGVTCGFGKDIIPTTNGNRDFLVNRYSLKNKEEVMFINKLIIDDHCRSKNTKENKKRDNSLNNEENNQLAVCGVASSTIKIDPYGNVYPCSAVHEIAGNITNKSLSKIWLESPVMNHFRGHLYSYDKFKTCKTCKYQTYCENRCMGHFKTETDDYFTPPNYFCDEKKIIGNYVENR